jgi:integrase
MASIGNDKGGLKRVLFVDPSGKRQTIRLGKSSKRIAETAKGHIERLLSAKIAGHSPDPETAKWLSGVADVLHERLVKVGLVPSRSAKLRVTLEDFLNRYIESRIDIKPRTRSNKQQCAKKLISFFGSQKPLIEIIEGDADGFKLWLIKQNLAPATISMHIKIARQFFKAALRNRHINQNPFEGIKAGKQTNADKIYFVDRETIEAVLEACPNTQWQLVFAFARYGGLRIPSEINFLRWSDVNWAKDRITITVPKKAHIDGQQTRVIPIFPELRPFLEKAFEEAAEGEEYVVPMARQSTNLGTHARRIIKKASVSVWPKVFTNLRASIEKELMQQEPSYKVQAWIGHTDAVARGHYLKVNDEDYVRAAGKAAQNPAHSASVRRRQEPSQPAGSKENPVKAGTSKNPIPPREAAPLIL